jgi:hypothetical protein
MGKQGQAELDMWLNSLASLATQSNNRSGQGCVYVYTHTHSHIHTLTHTHTRARGKFCAGLRQLSKHKFFTATWWGWLPVKISLNVYLYFFHILGFKQQIKRQVSA